MLWFGGYQTHSNTDSYVLESAQESQYFERSGLLPLLKAKWASRGLITAALLRQSRYHTQLQGRDPGHKEVNAPKVTQPLKWQDWAVCIPLEGRQINAGTEASELDKTPGSLVQALPSRSREQRSGEAARPIQGHGARTLLLFPRTPVQSPLAVPCCPQAQYPQAQHRSLGKPHLLSKHLRPKLSGSSCSERLQ